MDLSTIKQVLFPIILFSLSYAFGQYQCNDDPLRQIYPNQNMCLLLNNIPVELQNLPYGVYPNTDLYNTDRFNYNKRFNVFPHAIFIPDTYAQVIYVVSILKQYNLPFALRSGGHCFGPGSLSSGYVIDLRNFNAIIPDVANQQVFIGAGARLGNVVETLGALDFAIPTGTCPSVGITGLALAGGIGFLTRQLGLTCDSILNITLLTADLQIIQVNKTTNPDLFWAMCGAGSGSFGIVLDMTFQMYYLPQVSALQLTFNWDAKKIFTIFRAWQHWITMLPDSISTEFQFANTNGQSKVVISALKTGAEQFNEWKAVFNKFDPSILFTTGSYTDAASIFAVTPTPPFIKAKSKFLFKPLCKPGIAVVIDFFDALNNSSTDFNISFTFGAAGGKSAQGDTAYFARHAFEYFFMFIRWNFQQESEGALSLMNELYDAISRYVSPFSYANLVDFDISVNYLIAYYGNKINRLIRVKNAYDPLNLFTWRQAIPLSFTSPIAQKIKAKYCQLSS